MNHKMMIFSSKAHAHPSYLLAHFTTITNNTTSISLIDYDIPSTLVVIVLLFIYLLPPNKSTMFGSISSIDDLMDGVMYNYHFLYICQVYTMLRADCLLACFS